MRVLCWRGRCPFCYGFSSFLYCWIVLSSQEFSFEFHQFLLHIIHLLWQNLTFLSCFDMEWLDFSLAFLGLLLVPQSLIPKRYLRCCHHIAFTALLICKDFIWSSRQLLNICYPLKDFHLLVCWFAEAWFSFEANLSIYAAISIFFTIHFLFWSWFYHLYNLFKLWCKQIYETKMLNPK